MPYFTMRLQHWNGAAWLALGTYEVLQATLTRMKYDVFVQEDLLEEVDEIVNSNYAIDIERGLTVDGVKYSIVSNNYYIVDITYSEHEGRTHIVAELLPSMSIYDVSMAQPLRDIFEDIFDQINSSYIAWDNSRDIWYDWTPPEDEGEVINLTDTRQMIYECYVRLFSYIFPRWYKNILIYGVASNYDNDEDGNYTPFPHAKLTKFLWPDKPVNLSWQSESGTQTYEPDAQTANYASIGSIKDADDPSADPQFQEWGRVFNGVCYQYIQRPDLNLEQGDLVKVSTDSFTEVRCFEQMEFFKRGKNPRWVQVVRQLPYHPQHAYIEDWIDWFYTTPYTMPTTPTGSGGVAMASHTRNPSGRDIQVNSGLFTNVLDVNDSNVQTALFALDKAVITDHGDLAGLTDDDHPYVKKAGDTMTGDLSFSGGEGFIIQDTSETRQMRVAINYNSAGSGGTYIGFSPVVAGQLGGFELYPGLNATTSMLLVYGGGTPNSSKYQRLAIRSSKTGGVNFQQKASGTGYAVGDYTFFLGSATTSFIFKAFVSQSANIIEWQTSASVLLGSISGVGVFHFGAPTNYAQIDTDGEITLHGTAKVLVDLYISASGVKAPGAKPATFVELGLTGVWQFADQAVAGNQESISGTLKLPSQMDKTVAPEFKIGWSADGVSPGDCEWQLEYLYVSPNEATNAAAQETLSQAGTASSTSNGLNITTITGLDLPSSTDQAMLFKLTRLSAGGNDTIVDSVELRGMLFTHTRDKLGTPT